MLPCDSYISSVQVSSLMHLKARLLLLVFLSTSQGIFMQKLLCCIALNRDFCPFFHGRLMWLMLVSSFSHSTRLEIWKRNLHNCWKFEEVNFLACFLHLLRSLSSNAIYFQLLTAVCLFISSSVPWLPVPIYFFLFLTQEKMTKQTELLSCPFLSPSEKCD